MTINERIRHLRKDLLKINQHDFAQKIKLKQTTVSFMEKEGSTITEQNIDFICKTFGVREEWLKYGEEPIYALDEEEDPYTAAIAEIDIKDPRARQAILDYWRLSPEDKELFWKFADRFLKHEKKENQED